MSHPNRSLPNYARDLPQERNQCQLSVRTLLDELNKNNVLLSENNHELDKMKSSLAETKSFSSQLYHDHPCCLITVNKRGDILDSNCSFERFIGAHKNSEKPENIISYIPEERVHTFSRRFHHYFSRPRKKPIDAVLLKSNGSKVFVRLFGRKVKSPQNEPQLIITIEDISEIKSLQHSLFHRSYYDHLTNLPKRRVLEEHLNTAFATAARTKKTGALLFIRLNSLKDINDTLGHRAGDCLIKTAAQRLSKCIRTSDVAYRFANNEFAIILTNDSINENEMARKSYVVAQKLQSSLENPYFISGKEHNITISIGIELFPDRNKNSAECLAHSDTAMSAAKHSGKRKALFFEDKMQQKVCQRLELDSDLKKAIREDQFDVYYQPQLNNTKQIIGVEALIRWKHPTRGILKPNNFIHAAEANGLSGQLSERVFVQTLQNIKKWSELKLWPEHIKVAINISAEDLIEKNFAKNIQKHLLQTGIDASQFIFEITEHSLMNINEKSLSLLKTFKESGCRISIDDFGTGFSSFTYLKKLPIDEIKIDQSFINGSLTDKKDNAIVDAIINMANDIGINCVIEGIENPLQFEKLSKKKCKAYQGYYFCHPVPADILTSYLQVNQHI